MFKKTNDNKKPMKQLFLENADTVEEAFKVARIAIELYIDGKKEESNVKIEEVIQIEKKSDRIREAIIERLFTKETMVFSRADRLSIIERLDDIVDKLETLIRYLRQNKKVKFPQEISDDLKKAAGGLETNGILTKNLIYKLLENFDAVKPVCDEIENNRRDIRESLWNLSDKLFELGLDYLDFFYLRNLIKSLNNVSDNMENFSDYIYGLLCKYAL